VYELAGDLPGVAYRRIEDCLLLVPEFRAFRDLAEFPGLGRLDGKPDGPDTIDLQAQRVRRREHLRAEAFRNLIAAEQPGQAFPGSFGHR
jgi:hypothetical protein